MNASTTKEILVKILVDIRNPVVDREFGGRSNDDSSNQDLPLIKSCNSLINDLDWMFRYTLDEQNWSHIENLGIESPFKNVMSIDIVASKNISDFLFERAESYFSQNLIKKDELDWFYLDFIVAVNYRVQAKKLSDDDFSSSYPNLWKAIEKFDGSNYLALLTYGLGKVIKNGIGVFIVLVLCSMASEGYPILGAIAFFLVAFKCYRWYGQMRKFSKLSALSREKLKKIQQLYALFSSGIVRWNLLVEDIKNLRLLGVDFPLAIDSAITRQNLCKR